MHPSVYLRKCELVVNCQWLKFNAVNSQSPENQRGQWSNAQKELVKVLTSMAIESMGVLYDIPIISTDTPVIVWI